MSNPVDTYEPMVHEVSATARMGAHPNGTWVKASDYEAALRRAEEAERKLAESEGYPGIAHDMMQKDARIADRGEAVSSVKRYSEQEIADAWTRYRMAIKGNAVPDAILFVRAEHFEKVTMMLVQAQHDRQREHDLRVKINNEAETLRDAHRIAVDRHSVTLNELTAARSALTAERTRRGALEAALRSMPCGCITNGRSTIPPQPDDFTHTIQCARCAALSSGKTDGTV